MTQDTPKLWRDMTPEEKGALLLARHEGKEIESYRLSKMWRLCDPCWEDDVAYRVKPEPKRETVTVFGYAHTGHWSLHLGRENSGDQFRITFDLVDGEPDCASIKMERIK